MASLSPLEKLEEEARASTERYLSGKSLSIFDGVPICIKEMFDVSGTSNTIGLGGWRSDSKHVSRSDSALVAALRSCGALIIGSSTMDEIGISVRGYSASWGQVRNAVNDERVAGGSSSGSASAVGAGFCVVGLGSDGGGSIRIPAALNGIVGLKPTYARLTCDGCPLSLGKSVTHAGPLANCVLDAAYFYYLSTALVIGDVPVGAPDPRGDLILGLESDGRPSVKGLRVGVYWKWLEDSSERVRKAAESCIKWLKDEGNIELFSVSIPMLEEIRCAHNATITSGMYIGIEEYYNDLEFRKTMGLDVQAKLAVARNFARGLDAEKFQKASKIVRAQSMEYMQELFKTVDVILTPATAQVAPLVADNQETGEVNVEVDSKLMRYMQLGNVTGLPCGVVQVAEDDELLPIGVQVIGNAWEESTVLKTLWWIELQARNHLPVRNYRRVELLQT
eukprot:CAMPEP_0182448088 /NCGR_PEP_ID=MMETSP1172-20130603/23393_1 /TAXON_ID=708627 /ORGANISM="Timspurckia oligopyrenoides, Strain CCMP3278" /LENGTH=449 /DNA_ID=CAMNT_0024644809 /DNA_START=624 /DNA_END=1973 /DNA_ORIENTATION=+